MLHEFYDDFEKTCAKPRGHEGQKIQLEED
jgi:hypothetical protein